MLLLIRLPIAFKEGRILIMKKLLGIIAFLIIVSLITAGIIFYARGYRPDFKNGKIGPTGVVSIKSNPSGAEVFIEGESKGTTNLDIPDLKPGKYLIKMEKDGFSSWEKEIEVKKEAVNLIKAVLFPIAPSLRALTFTGIINPVVSDNGAKIAFYVANPEEKAGIWVLNLSTNTLPSFFTKDLTQVVTDTEEISYSLATYEFSPNSEQLLLNLKGENRFLLLGASEENEKPKEVTLDIQKIQGGWEQQRDKEQESALKALGKEAQNLASTLTDIKLSPKKGKFIGKQSNGNAILFDSDPGPTPNQKPLSYQLPKALKYIWFPGDEHVVLVNKASISILEADTKNSVTIYTGGFDNNFVAPWPDSSKIVVATSLNTAISELSNLYAIELR